MYLARYGFSTTQQSSIEQKSNLFRKDVVWHVCFQVRKGSFARKISSSVGPGSCLLFTFGTEQIRCLDLATISTVTAQFQHVHKI